MKNMISLNKIIIYALIAASACTCFFQAGFNIFLGIAFAGGLYKIYRKKLYEDFLSDRICVLMLICWASLAISTLFSVNIKDSIHEVWSTYINTMLPYILIILVSKDMEKEKLEYIIWGGFFSLLVTTVPALWQFAHGDIRPVGLSQHWMYLGGYYCLFVPIILIMSINRQMLDKVWKKISLFVIALLGFAGLLANNTRGVWIAVFIISVFIIASLGRNNGKILLCGFISLCFFVGIIFTTPVLKKRVTTATVGITQMMTGKVGKHASEDRWYMWRGTVYMIKDKPIFGHGPGTYKEVYNSQYLLKGAGRGYSHAHNLYLTIASESGLLCLFTFMLLHSYVLYDGLRLYFKRNSIYGLILASIIMGLLLQGVTEFPGVRFKINWLLIGWAYIMLYKEKIIGTTAE